jgi:hypothetical protein
LSKTLPKPPPKPKPQPQPKPKAPPKAKATKIQTFPIGIDRGRDTVRLVWVRRGQSRPTVVEAPIIDGNAAKTIRAVLDREGIATRTVVMGVRGHEARLDRGTFTGIKKNELERAATVFYQKEFGPEISQYQIRAEPLGNGEAVMGAIKKTKLAEFKAIAKNAGLKLVAIDNEAFAWRRLVSDVDGVIAFSDADASLTLFDKQSPRIYTFAKSDWVGQMSELVTRMRADTASDFPRTFHSVGSTDDVTEIMEIEDFVNNTRSNVKPLEVTDPRTGEVVQSPPWLFAYALATQGLTV